jgi:hypothetical protein
MPAGRKSSARHGEDVLGLTAHESTSIAPLNALGLDEAKVFELCPAQLTLQ